MVTFRLYYLGTDGRTMGAVPEILDSADAPDFESRHASTARRAAGEAAARAEVDVLIVRAVKDAMQPAYVMRPDGRRANPPGTVAIERERCTEGSGRPCFCSACRAERKAARS